MAVKFDLSAEPRIQTGKRASRRFRTQDRVLATVYGAEKDPQSITLDHNKILKAMEKEAFYSSILNLNLNDQVEKVVIKAIQRHPSRPRILHMDFLRINLKEKLTMHIPLHFNNEATSPAVKAGGVISHYITEVEVRCLPSDLPEYIEVDLSGIEMNQTIYLTDLKLASGVELVELSHGAVEEHNKPVANAHPPHVMKEPIETTAPVSAEVEAIRVASDEAVQSAKEAKDSKKESGK